MIEKFKLVVFILIALELLWFLVPTQWSYFGNERALYWLGEGSLFPTMIDILMAYLFSFAYIVIYLALYSFRAWARVGLAIILTVELVHTMFSGILVYSGFEAALGKLLILGAGLVLVLSHSKSLESEFHK